MLKYFSKLLLQLREKDSAVFKLGHTTGLVPILTIWLFQQQQRVSISISCVMYWHTFSGVSNVVKIEHNYSYNLQKIPLESNFQLCRLDWLEHTFNQKESKSRFFILNIIVTYYKYAYEMTTMVYSFLWMPS